jgi:4-aminobutyrate aminotransferase-like enzyme/Ser/Thr protein kinase RdoA (MazF antagonist)/murein DD-endopeptidase MepM/ murein hydrolase activator NlpD
MTVTTRIAPPRFSEPAAAALARDLWGLAGRLSPLPSERDQNFRLTTEAGERFVLKISEPAESRGVLECQNAMLARLVVALPAFGFPAFVPDHEGRAIAEVAGEDGGIHLVRLLRYVPGVPLGDVRRHPPALLRDAGRLTGSMAGTLQGFAHSAAHRDLRWDLQTAPGVIATCLEDVARADRRKWIERLLAMYDREAAPLLGRLATSVIHNDVNDYNLLVSAADPADPGAARRVTGLVDFGDVVHSYTVADLAVAAAYAMLHKRDPLAAASHVVEGYAEAHVPEDAELAALFPMICLRLCLSAVLAAHQRAQEPENEYLSISEAPVWVLLEHAVEIHPHFAHYRFRSASGLVPCAATAAVTAALSANPARCGPVLDPDPRTATRVTLDLTVGSAGWDALDGRDDAAAWTEAIARRMAASGAAAGIGRYDEARRLYTAEQFRVATDDGEEWRTIHIGVDLFAPAGTAVLAPLDGVVHSVRDNAGRLDYGPTVILRHDAADAGPTFFTLYGHLDPGVFGHLRAGQRVRQGERIARLGAPADNGGWAPHLHLQLITDLLGFEGDFPGVARPSEREVWLSLSPDPNLILGFPEGCRAPRPSSREALLANRRQRIGPSLSIAYHEPLTIVRGSMQYLYDDQGRAYLDVVNNVAHVGHCHPRVVEAIRRQSAVLNTNTRYLHPVLAEYAERLAALLPSPLSVCFFVCSGSEANELALRLARTHTGREDVVVVDHAYHGNTSSLVSMSPYKFNGPGGRGAPPWVHTVVMPDPYRGPHRGRDAATGRRYAEYVRDAFADARRGGRQVAAFFAEAIISGGGHIEPPEGYLSGAYAYARAAGGVCVADEVQVGFGRVGTHFWAFEAQGVVPDIVTMGKPIGNGHPLGAVVTTPEIAASFANGMEYFNTFGGNAVSCCAGLAVLDVLQGEGLQEHARVTGAELAAGLRGLQERHALIGDVRGRGLLLAIELVRDRTTLEPAPRHAAYVVERMRERGILLSTEGPLHTVIKMKPPLAFTRADAQRLVRELDETLREIAPAL